MNLNNESQQWIMKSQWRLIQPKASKSTYLGLKQIEIFFATDPFHTKRMLLHLSCYLMSVILFVLSLVGIWYIAT